MRHRETAFPGKDGADLYAQCWLPDKVPQAIVAIVHGVAEHSGRYGRFANALCANGYGAWGYDLRGHGRSHGRRGHINTWREYRADLGLFLQWVQNETSECPIFLFGHSMGALIALDFLIEEPAEIAGLIVSGTPIEPAGVAKPYLVTLAHLLARLWPTFLLPLNLDASALSRDTAVVNAYVEDPLILRRMTARWGTESLAAVARVKNNAGRLTLPLLMLHGEADTLNIAAGAQILCDRAGSNDKLLRLFPGARHELHNDLCFAQVIGDMLSWMAYRTE